MIKTDKNGTWSYIKRTYLMQVFKDLRQPSTWIFTEYDEMSNIFIFYFIFINLSIKYNVLIKKHHFCIYIAQSGHCHLPAGSCLFRQLAVVPNITKMSTKYWTIPTVERCNGICQSQHTVHVQFYFVNIWLHLEVQFFFVTIKPWKNDDFSWMDSFVGSYEIGDYKNGSTLCYIYNIGDICDVIKQNESELAHF